MIWDPEAVKSAVLENTALKTDISLTRSGNSRVDSPSDLGRSKHIAKSEI